MQHPIFNQMTKRFFLTLLVGLVFSASEMGSMALASQPGHSQDSQSHRALGIPPMVLEKAGLGVRWSFAELPLGSASRISQMFYHQGQLFVLNDHNKLYAINGKNGTIQWTVDLTKHRMDPAPIGFYKKSLLFVFGQTFLQVRLSDGVIEEKIEFDVELATSADRSEDRVFFGGVDSRFYSVRTTDQVPVWKSVCATQPTGRVTVAQGQVYFVTKDNTLYVSTLEDRQLLWKASTVGPLVGAIVDGPQCFLPSEDTALYCFEPKQGHLQWKYLTGGPLVELPVVTEKLLFQSVEHKSLLCLNRNDGSLQWELKDGKGLLALNGRQAYAMTLDNHLALMDNKTGQRILSFYAEGVDLFASNTEDSLIFLATKSGDLLALQPNRLAAKANEK